MQLLMERIELSVRNSTAYQVKELDGGAQALIAQVRSTDSTQSDAPESQRCVGFVFDPSSETVYYSTTTGVANPSPVKAVASNGTWSKDSWAPFIQGLASDKGILTSAANGSLDVKYEIQPQDRRQAPVKFESSFSPIWPNSNNRECFS
ncbi:hypothetical protein ACFSYH_03590 [Populibacterium corticicola]|uniref:Uncharacterized protein n=1 Tax=Populibacterium corticicola TaxID=1812826 RepID=A0ABW5XEY4_9MICO